MKVLVKTDTNDFELQEVDLGTQPQTPSSEPFPTGIICMWSGAVASIPTGWLLCNGLNGTPDLTDKFIMGTATTPGQVGGSATHTHTAHTVTQPAAHGTQAIKYGTTGTSLTVLKSPGTHTGTAVTAHDTVDNRPPYYALAFIIKV